MDRSQKAESVASLNATFNEVGVVVITRNLGMSVAQSTALRGKVRDAGATYKVAKNRLAKLAIKDTTYEGLDELFTGPTAIATSVDPVAAAKADATGYGCRCAEAQRTGPKGKEGAQNARETAAMGRQNLVSPSRLEIKPR